VQRLLHNLVQAWLRGRLADHPAAEPASQLATQLYARLASEPLRNGRKHGAVRWKDGATLSKASRPARLRAPRTEQPENGAVPMRSWSRTASGTATLRLHVWRDKIDHALCRRYFCEEQGSGETTLRNQS
jgi:hypothetical protein